MIEFRAKLWSALGAVALASSGALMGCGPGEKGEVPASSVAGGGEAGESGAEHGGGAADQAFAGLPMPAQQALAVALMRAHLLVAKTLVQEGDVQSAAPHFAHPIYEVFETHRQLFTSVRATPPQAPFDALNAAAAAGRDVAQIAPLYPPADDAIRALQPKENYDQFAVIRALLVQMRAEYGEGVRDGAVVNAIEYQDAFGMAHLISELLKDAAMPGQDLTEVQREATALAAMLPSAKPPAAPAAPGAVLAQSSRLELALAGLIKN